uniref:Uncharacterized protein n=1 Tax=Calcidiscus leptoporus TaxID=127549 RepID=A0A7S0JIQ6_9EUKA
MRGLLREAAQATLAVAAVATVGTLYVLVHERRRRAKALRRADSASNDGAGSAQGGVGGSQMMSREQLLTILEQSSTAAYQLIEQTRKMVYSKHQATGQSLETVVEELQKDFEHAMETVVFQIRKNHGVTEEQMTRAMVANQSDPQVTAALTTLREAMSGKAPPPTPAQEVKRGPARRGKAKRKG